jgi:hypothetical protein
VGPGSNNSTAGSDISTASRDFSCDFAQDFLSLRQPLCFQVSITLFIKLSPLSEALSSYGKTSDPTFNFGISPQFAVCSSQSYFAPHTVGSPQFNFGISLQFAVRSSQSDQSFPLELII